MTVLEKIRQMDAEEFLEFIGPDAMCSVIRQSDPDHCRIFEERGDCDACVECWLKKRVDYDDLYVE